MNGINDCKTLQNFAKTSPIPVFPNDKRKHKKLLEVDRAHFFKPELSLSFFESSQSLWEVATSLIWA